MITAPQRRLSPQARTVWALQQAGGWASAGVVAYGLSRVDALGWWPLAVVIAGAVVCVPAVPLLRWARWRWDVREPGIDIRHGTLTVRQTLIPWVRVQHVDTRSGVLEQSLNLATVVIHTAAGAHTIPLLPERDAEELRDRIAELARTDPDA